MAQLVQQEKLASLGQLTAGIAHEIKNPLNFVNNFASVSLELVEELKQDVDGFQFSVIGEDSPQKTDNRKLKTRIDENFIDLKTNLGKIHEHGSRADKIVKSMLLHSRGGSGKMEPTDVNALLQEYGNLAFHGMRAGKNPITVDIRYELDPKAGSIPMVAEDFSRVILNLCNNAFDAMRDSAMREPSTLILRSKRTPDSLLIEIEDNGPGIPDEIKARILEPFFTTKKGTEGTGLGLSISNDIMQAHRGQMSIDSVPGRTTFILTLPC
jgi:signal transduction histidine kinase